MLSTVLMLLAGVAVLGFTDFASADENDHDEYEDGYDHDDDHVDDDSDGYHDDDHDDDDQEDDDDHHDHSVNSGLSS